MHVNSLFRKTPATLDEIRVRVTACVAAPSLCRNVQFDVVSTPRTPRGYNWTVSLRSIEPERCGRPLISLPDIQEAYETFRRGLIFANF